MHHLQSIPQLFATHPELLGELIRLFPTEQKIAITVSGGSDSMLLSSAVLTFWTQKKWNPDQLFFIHCNHKVRPESDEEARFVRSFFAGYQLKISERTEDIKINEESLRERRYTQFLQLMQEEHIAILLTGHNLTDRIEGTLLNMLRGCGIVGFIGMQAQESHHLLEQRQVYRPLLSLTKMQIQSLCQAYDIPYVHDPSNDDPTTSKRNLIRNTFLFPLAEQALQTGKRNTFFWSRSQIYAHLEELQTTQAFQFLKPIPLNPYRGLSHAYEWAVMPEWKNQLRLSNLLTRLGIDYT
ncbi:MAG: tRNA lysidine(34) synthetase TilS [bacterium]|nr:tRNA lysidine(34) synthetase TilS [bacterium]